MAADLAVEAETALEVDQATRSQSREVRQPSCFLQHVKLQLATRDLHRRETAAVDGNAVAGGDSGAGCACLDDELPRIGSGLEGDYLTCRFNDTGKHGWSG